ncbi:MAG: hypothetical protein R2823_07185 [Acidimicrobiia bacterium]
MTTSIPDGEDRDNGSWFLEAVGAAPPSPSGADAIADLTRENDMIADGPAASAPSDERRVATTTIRTTSITVSSFDGDPGTLNATYDRRRLPPQPAAAAATMAPNLPPPPPMPEAKQVIEPVNEPPSDAAAFDEELPRQLRSRRSYRWPIVVVLILLIVAVGIAAIWLPRATESEAIAVRQRYYDATVAVRNQLPGAQSALDAITTIDSTPESLSTAIPMIAELDSAAFTMQEVASEPLPSILPLVPKGPIDALEPLKQETAILGTEGSELAGRLGNGYVYRVRIPTMLSPGNLPTTASSETINTISVTLAASLADDAAALAELPDEPTFGDVKAAAQASHARYTDWQTEYLSALSEGNTTVALALVTELDALRASLMTEEATALGAFRTEIDGRIVNYAGELETHMDDLTQI